MALRLPKKNAFFGAVASDFSFREDEPEPLLLEASPVAALPPLGAALATELGAVAWAPVATNAPIPDSAAALEAIAATRRRVRQGRVGIRDRFT